MNLSRHLEQLPGVAAAKMGLVCTWESERAFFIVMEVEFHTQENLIQVIAFLLETWNC